MSKSKSKVPRGIPNPGADISDDETVVFTLPPSHARPSYSRGGIKFNRGQTKTFRAGDLKTPLNYKDKRGRSFLSRRGYTILDTLLADKVLFGLVGENVRNLQSDASDGDVGTPTKAKENEGGNPEKTQAAKTENPKKNEPGSPALPGEPGAPMPKDDHPTADSTTAKGGKK